MYIYICLYFHSCWLEYKIQIELQITCNLYTDIYTGSTQQYIMITVVDDIDSLQVQLTGSPRDRHAKTHAGPPTGIPQPGPWLVGGCSASQSEARPENPRQPTRIHAWDSPGITLPRYVHITVLEYLCTFGISLDTLNVWNMQFGDKLISTLECIGLQIRTVWDVRPHAMTCDLYQLPWHSAKHLIQQSMYCCESPREWDIEKGYALHHRVSAHNIIGIAGTWSCIADLLAECHSRWQPHSEFCLYWWGYELLFATKRLR